MSAKIIVTEVPAKDLQPGDLFSIAPQEYWDRVMDGRGVGEVVYVRTNLPCSTADDVDTMVFKITIEKKEDVLPLKRRRMRDE